MCTVMTVLPLIAEVNCDLALSRQKCQSATSRPYLIKSSTQTGTNHSRNGKLWNVEAGLLRLDAGELDHLAPLLGFVGD